MKPWRPVVSYRNSTSNHNEAGITRNQRSVVSYRNSTSNHNKRFAIRSVTLLYLIEILHQTTTIDSQLDKSKPLYLIEILHQTTTSSGPIVCITSCILSKFYIKPQLDHPSVGYCFVVSYRNSTSNHNSCLILLILRMVVSYRNSTSNHNSAFVTRSDTLLYLIEILHQTTTFDFRPRFSPGCILSKFYIKPQLICCSSVWRECCILSKFYIKPQRIVRRGVRMRCCILSKFYIKPQPVRIVLFWKLGCILSKFYIKPQLRRQSGCYVCVVSYRNSTSNHNLSVRLSRTCLVVSYRNSTSNHNGRGSGFAKSSVVSYRNSTSNHNRYLR